MPRRTPSPGPNRRTFLAFTGVSAATLALGIHAPTAAAPRTDRVPDSPFGLGVASGDPRPDGMVLWTRLAPEPLAPDGHGGMGDADVTVEYQVATDERFTRVVSEGRAVASAELAHAVHPEITGLEPGRDYFYRFRAGGEISPVGRTRTAPAPGAAVPALSLALASCQAWYHGHFTAYRDMAQQDLDLVMFLGDYIYEYGITDWNLWRRGTEPLGVEHTIETVTLTQYRLRYALFKSDPHLQAAHAAFPWVLTADDHEVQDDYAGGHSEYGITPEDFLRRRAVAYRAWYENQPLSSAALPQGPDMRRYRTLRYGRLAEFHMLDTRQYRDPPPTDRTPDGEHAHPARSLLGRRQENWLYAGLRRGDATWNTLVQQVPMTQVELDPGGEPGYNSYDGWDGFTANRDRLFDTLTRHRVPNPLVFTGDIHRHAAADLKRDFRDPDSETVATEVIATSIASNGDGTPTDGLTDRWMNNPHVRFYNAQRGYARVTLTPERAETDFRVVDQIEADDTGTTSTYARFVTEAGRPGLIPDGEGAP